MPNLKSKFAALFSGSHPAVSGLFLAGALALSAPAHATLTAQGSIWTFNGTSGTALTHNSSSGARLYRFNVVGQEAISEFGAPGTVINPAGSGLPATFNFVPSDQWNTTLAASGQTTVAVAETRQGQFSWSGPSYVYFEKHILTANDIAGNPYQYPNGNQQAIPTPLSPSVSSNSVTLQWAKLNDPSGIVSSYSVYRSTALPGASGSYPVTQLLPSTAFVSGATATFVDNSVSPNTTYYYTIAPNFVWTG